MRLAGVCTPNTFSDTLRWIKWEIGEIGAIDGKVVKQVKAILKKDYGIQLPGFLKLVRGKVSTRVDTSELSEVIKMFSGIESKEPVKKRRK